MKSNPLVSVIIPTNNRNEKLLNCLKSVFNSTYKDIEVIVVNDAPINKLEPLLKRYAVVLLNNKRRMFAAYSRNRGAMKAKGKLLFFLDDDNILDKRCISKMVMVYKNSMGLLGPAMYRKDGIPWFYGGSINWISPYANTFNKKLLRRKLIKTDVIPNAYMITKRKYLDAGMENYKLFPFHDDLDIAQKLIAKGYVNYILSGAKTTHDYGDIREHISPDRLYQMVRCNISAERLYAPPGRRKLFFIIFMPVHLLFYFLYYIPLKGINKWALYNSYIAGLVDGLSIQVRKES